MHLGSRPQVYRRARSPKASTPFYLHTPLPPSLRRHFGLRLCSLLLGLAAVFPSLTTAAIIVWADIGTDFATGANWINSVAPRDTIAFDIASFDTVATQNAPVLAANRRINGLQFTAAGSLTFSGAGTLMLGTSGINNSSTGGTKTIATSLMLAAVQSFTNDGALTGVMHEAEKHSFKSSGLGGSRMGRGGLTRFFRKKALIRQTGQPATIGMFDESHAAR